jgi:hypothetical protein
MSYQPLNPYVTNLVPLFNVSGQASGPTPTTTGLSNVQNLLNFTNKSLLINTINTYTPGTNLKIGNNMDINGDLTINSFSTGPDNTGFSYNACKRFIVSTPTTTVTINTKVRNIIVPNFSVNINNINAFYIDTDGNALFSNPVLAPAYNIISDCRFKSSITTLTNSLSTVCELEGKHYIFNGISSIGFLAQDLDLVIPSAVDKKNTDKWSINYMAIIPHLVESIKELNAKVSNLESKLRAVK